MVTNYTFFVKNASTGLGRAGLFPVFNSMRYVSSGDVVGSSVQPPITELGNGWYVFQWDPILNGEAVGIVDAGASVTVLTERYVPVEARVSGAERADVAVQLLHNKSIVPANGLGATTVYDRNGNVLSSSNTLNDGIQRIKTPTGSL